MAALASADLLDDEPIRTLCPTCDEPVLMAVLPSVPRHRREACLVIAEPWEWEPRTRCYICATIEARVKRCPACNGNNRRCRRCNGAGIVRGNRANCDRCGGEGYVGRERPAERMLAIDIAWSDEGHVRLIGPRVRRRKGEALYELHACDQPAIVSGPEPLRKVTACFSTV